ncbi:MAG: flagellar hook-length control protein FliK [Magnetococcales bacterium]|nr:flagellar hook-length control protein FliK [Magnetococcales bacterium]
MKIIPGLLPPAPVPEGTPVTGAIARLNVGDLLTGRVTQMGHDGHGVIRFPDGSGIRFAQAPALRVGESVQVELLRLLPEMTFRLLDSASQTAARLATSVEQSLVRAPDLFAHLLRWSGVSSGNRALLQNSLPTVSVQALLRGEITELAQLLETGSRQDLRATLQQLRQGMVELLLESDNRGVGQRAGGPQAEGIDAQATRNTLHRLGDLLAMQELLPRMPLSPEGGQLMGYRLFWLMEGGMGEAIWYQQPCRRREEGEEEKEQEGQEKRPPKTGQMTTMLLSLNMTQLGAVQARVSFREGLCAVRIAAEEEESLAALRRRIGELRLSLLSAELPLQALDLARLGTGELRAQRMQALGLASQFSAEA